MGRTISLSRTGRFVLVRTTDGLALVDALGTAPRVTLPGPAVDFACLGSLAWLLRGTRIDRFALATGREVAPPIELPRSGRSLIADRSEFHAAVVTGAHVLALETQVIEIPDAEHVLPLAGHRVAVVNGDVLEIVELGRRPIARTRIANAAIGAVHPLYGGRLLAVHARADANDVWTVLRHDASRVHQIVTPAASAWAVAVDAGVAIGLIEDGTRWQRIDLRYGTARDTGETPIVARELELAADGRHVVFGGDEGFSHLPTVDLAVMRATPVVVEVEDEVVDESEPPAETTPTEAEPLVEPPPPPESAIVTTLLADIVPAAFGERPRLVSAADPAAAPYRSSREHFDDMLDLVHARAEVHLGRAERGCVDALLGRIAGRVRSSLAAGVRLPFLDLLRELDVSPIAGHVLMVALAPIERGETAQLFRAIAQDAQRPLVDRALVETLLAGTDRARRAEISNELANGRLVQLGALEVAAPHAFAAITVEPTVLARLCDRLPRPPITRPIEELWLPEAAARALAAIMTRSPASPLRLVMRGRRGSGRRSVIAALAARADRAVIEIDCTRFPRAGSAMAAALHAELRRALLCGRIPILSGLELADGSDVEGQDRLRLTIAAHAGPIVIRTSHEAALPLAPGFDTVVIAPPTETERALLWRRAGIGTHADQLAARWRLGPGQITRVVAEARDERSLHELAAQHLATRMGHIATPVRKLPQWEQVALAEDVMDSIREFIGRAAHRKTVLDEWGFDAKLSTSRGLTALFYGPPGTGKTMVAGLIARELGLELYRVDLSKVFSKWLGETEKQLGEVFDAAEDGQIVLLFDEADSLFARRTEVKSSNDRYANLEVNYLLQRLDSFEGIAILTTNLDGSIDPAFKRRLSLRLCFPFPDEELRKRLWAAHVPPGAPTARDFNFDELARRFPLSGGYIRNSVLRAAYLAAQERRPLAHEHFLRAIALEYRELGKLATDGRLE